MAEEVLIYGKNGCPYTDAARDDYQARGVAFRYINVKKDPAELERMLALTKGQRRVPVIVDQGKVTIGFGGT
jgi:glutaredoxin 3